MFLQNFIELSEAVYELKVLTETETNKQKLSWKKGLLSSLPRTVIICVQWWALPGGGVMGWILSAYFSASSPALSGVV